MKSLVIHRINAILCGMAGLFSLFVAFSVYRLAGSEEIDLTADEANLVPVVIAFCLVYGLVCLFYAYCRFLWDKEGHNRLLLFCRKWLVYVLMAAAHGMSLVWMIPVLFGLTDLRSVAALPLGLLAFANFFTDTARYFKKLGGWMKEAMLTKIKKKSA